MCRGRRERLNYTKSLLGGVPSRAQDRHKADSQSVLHSRMLWVAECGWEMAGRRGQLDVQIRGAVRGVRLQAGLGWN